jgi:hypothetical protein
MNEIEAGGTGERGCEASLQRKACLKLFEELNPLAFRRMFSDRWNKHGGDERHAPDPQND